MSEEVGEMREISLQGLTWKGMAVVQICVLYEFIYCTCTVDSAALISSSIRHLLYVMCIYI